MGPVPPVWGIPQDVASLAAHGTFNTTGSITTVDGTVRFLRFAKGARGVGVRWYLLSDSETTGEPNPVFPIEDTLTVSVLTQGTWSSTLQTMVFNGVTYNLGMQRSSTSGRDIAVAVPA